MRWTVLVDNRTNEPALEAEHGLSVFLETECHRILLDTGASDMLIRNAERLGIDLRAVDYVFISHGHSDHAGGLKHFMTVNDEAKIIVSPGALNGKFFSKRRYLHSITAEWPEIPRERLLAVDHSGETADGLHVIANIPHAHPMPKGNQHLFAQNPEGAYIPDDFRHELALYTDGLLFTGCAHSGLENILAATPFSVHEVEKEFLLSFFNDPHFLDRFGYLQADRTTPFLKPDEPTFERILSLYQEMKGEIIRHAEKDQHILRAMLYGTMMLLQRVPMVEAEATAAISVFICLAMHWGKHRTFAVELDIQLRREAAPRHRASPLHSTCTVFVTQKL